MVCHECGATLEVGDPDVGARFAAELQTRYGFAADLAHHSIAAAVPATVGRDASRASGTLVELNGWASMLRPVSLAVLACSLWLTARNVRSTGCVHCSTTES